MGEAWSDWYAMDFLVNQGLLRRHRGDGDLRVGEYVGAGNDLIRTQPLDCPVGCTSAKCPGTAAAGTGGYTYGDFGKIAGGPEVHADGEIWGETLWDLRARLGSRAAESLVTRAMELSPANPSFLDMRNAILPGRHRRQRRQATTARSGRCSPTAAWATSPARSTATTPTPVEDFSLPPRGERAEGHPHRHGDRRQQHGAPLAGAVVVVRRARLPASPTYLAATTDAKGAYKIPGVFYGYLPRRLGRQGFGYDTRGGAP